MKTPKIKPRTLYVRLVTTDYYDPLLWRSRAARRAYRLAEASHAVPAFKQIDVGVGDQVG